MPLRAWRSQRVCVRCSVVEDPDAPLTPEQIDHFLVNGYVALPGLFPEDFNDAMKRDVDRLVDDRAAKQAAPLIASSPRSARSQRNLLSKILGNLAALLFLAFSTPLAPARHARSRRLDPIRIDAVRICTSATQCPSACKHLSCSDRQRGRGRMARASAPCAGGPGSVYHVCAQPSHGSGVASSGLMNTPYTTIQHMVPKTTPMKPRWFARFAECSARSGSFLLPARAALSTGETAEREYIYTRSMCAEW